ncbi:MAG: hypothetical protein NTV88_04120 [Candidatus Micrarchaeota archaeon]|nr:hypothetical protein [Candidatus Micrarchaeota archaeon]
MQNTNHAYILHVPSQVTVSSRGSYCWHKLDIFLGFDKKASPEGIAIFKVLPDYINRQIGRLQSPPIKSGYIMYKAKNNIASMEDCYPKTYLKNEIGYFCYQIELWTTEYMESKGVDTIIPPVKMLQSRQGYHRKIGLNPNESISIKDLKEALTLGIKMGEAKYGGKAEV